MKPSERNLLILLGVLLVFAIPYISSLFNLGSSSDGTYYSEEKISELKHTKNQLPQINLLLLEKEKDSFQGSRRNLFSFGDAVAENSGDEDSTDSENEDGEDPYAVEETPEETAQEEEPVRQNLAGYQYVGYLLSNEKRTAAFEWRGQIFVGQIGDTINDAFKIQDIEENSTTIFVIKGDFEQQLKLRSPAGSDGGN